MAKLTLFSSFTSLWISDSAFCRNWKREAIRGRIFPSCRGRLCEPAGLTSSR